uniref:Sulfite reductase n=1 Tax=Geoglobus ahangari TaxID=113653 RepID=A0A7C3YCC0_9EURY
MVEVTPELEQKILEQLAKKPWQVRDLAKILKIKKKELDQIIQKLINEGKAAYWSSGSTTYVTTPEKLEEMEKKRSEG